MVVRAMSMISSTARSIATPASPGRPKLAQVPAMITSVARGTPATPFEVSMKVKTMTICLEIGMGTCAACAMVMLASTR